MVVVLVEGVILGVVILLVAVIAVSQSSRSSSTSIITGTGSISSNSSHGEECMFFCFLIQLLIVLCSGNLD